MANKMGIRNSYISEEDQANILAIFGHKQNAYRWLGLEQQNVDFFTFGRAMRGEPVREGDAVAIEGQWQEFCRLHNLGDEDFEGLADLPKPARQTGGTRPRRAQHGHYVEERVDLTADDLEFM